MASVPDNIKDEVTADPIDEARKRDALALAELLLDMYKESKMKGSPNNDKE
jgi:hypothetical protein